MNKQVLNLEQMEYLLELGVDTNDASYSMFFDTESREKFIASSDIKYGVLGTNIHFIGYVYSLQDILNKLPKRIIKDDTNAFFEIRIDPANGNYKVTYDPISEKYKGITVESEKDLLLAAYNMFVLLIKKGFIKVSKKYKLVCSQCGGSNIMILDWVDPNTNQYIGGNDDNEGWCEDCEENTKIKAIEV